MALSWLLGILAIMLVDGKTALSIGCVKYSDDIGSIWAGMSDYFATKDIDLGVQLYDSYEEQTQAFIKGDIDVAWNGPVAHAYAEIMSDAKSTVVSLGMRDVDVGMRSLVVARREWADKLGVHGNTLSSSRSDKARGVSDKVREAVQKAAASGRLVSGTVDSPQGYLIPLHHLRHDLDIKFPTTNVRSFNVDVGKHGDTAIGEVQAMEELAENKADLALVSEMMFERRVADRKDQSLPRDDLVVVESPILLDHCRFDVIKQRVSSKVQEDFTKALLEMDMNDEKHRPVMKAEGIRKSWVVSNSHEDSAKRDGNLQSAMHAVGMSDAYVREKLGAKTEL